MIIICGSLNCVEQDPYTGDCIITSGPWPCSDDYLEGQLNQENLENIELREMMSYASSLAENKIKKEVI